MRIASLLYRRTACPFAKLSMFFGIFLFLFGIFSSLAESSDSAVSYNYKKGRFGDQLLAFSHALWFSHILDMPLIYQPFPYSDQLHMHHDPMLIRHDQFSAQRKIVLNRQQDYINFLNELAQGSLKNVLLEVPFYPESRYLYETRPQPQFTQVNWDDPQFKERLCSLIAPLKTYPKMPKPQGRVAVALHYRSGLVYDDANFTKNFPLKGPPDTYYRDALALLNQIVAGPLYIRLFTDHPEPLKVQKKLYSFFPNEDFIIDCRADVTGPDQFVVEDFFALGEFEYLIRPESNFSIMASLLFPFKMVISPVHYHKIKNGIVVDQFLVEYGSKEKFKHPLRTILRSE